MHPDTSADSNLKIEHECTSEHQSAGSNDVEADLSPDVLLSLQIRAFLEASEDVDIDPETVEDLLQAIPKDDQDGNAELTVQVDSEDEDDLYRPADNDVEELDIGPLYTQDKEGEEEAWSKQEVKQMLHHLKERGMSSFMQEYVIKRNIPIPKLLLAFGINLCPQLQNRKPATMLYFLRVAMSHQLRMRDRLMQYNTIADAVQLIQNSQRILILTGAGISVSCGIPDFRSRNGLYATLKDRGEYDLDDPQQMFDINYFRENPSVFYSFAYQIYPSNFVPSPCHRFIKAVEDKGKLLQNYTQNIDTLETLAGVKRVLQCHGSFATASCLQCRRKVDGKEIEADILRRKVPLCTVCNVPTVPAPMKGKKKSRKKAKGEWDSDVEDESDGPLYPAGIMKPDITFFGEKLTDEFDHSLAEDRDKVDLLLVIGTSLKVSPVAEILSHLPHSIPQILINKTPIRHINPDIVLLGNADGIVEHLTDELGWELPLPPTIPPTSAPVASADSNTRLQPPRGNLKKRPSDSYEERKPPQRVGDSHVWLFDGAEGGKWLQDLKKEISGQSSAPVTGTNSPQPMSVSGSTETLHKETPKSREYNDNPDKHQELIHKLNDAKRI
ncbi:DHS-like NAD/FAD-binding domain-containing protein [Cyathus striatus]|nr:DHS-like NAD/FAD-binding domain-containing protein [Cyathus striatus]